MSHMPTVLILDHDPLRVMTYEELLKRQGFKPFSLNQGDDFSYYFGDLSPSLVIIDYKSLLQEENYSQILQQIENHHVLFLCDRGEQLDFSLQEHHHLQHYPLSLEWISTYLKM